MSELDDYIEAEFDKALRAKDRWLVDCFVCGKPLRTHGEKCVFDADQCQFKGIVGG